MSHFSTMADLLAKSRNKTQKRIAQSTRTIDMGSGPRGPKDLGEGIEDTSGKSISDLKNEDMGLKSKSPRLKRQKPNEDLDFSEALDEHYFTGPGDSPLGKPMGPEELEFDPSDSQYDQFNDPITPAPEEDPLVGELPDQYKDEFALPSSIDEAGYDPLNPLGLTDDEGYDLKEIELDRKPSEFDSITDQALRDQDERNRRKQDRGRF